MDFKLDAFPVDDNTGGIRSTEKIRIIICYVLKYHSGSLSKDNLISALYDNGIANYFELCQAIDDLLEVNAVFEDNDKLFINEKAFRFPVILKMSFQLTSKTKQ